MDKEYDLSEIILQAMGQLDINQAELARRSGVSKQTISDYVNRKRLKPDPAALAAIAKVLQLPVETIYKAAKIPTSKPSSNTTEMDSVMEAMRDLPLEWQAKIAEDARRTREFYEAQVQVRLTNNARVKKGTGPLSGGA